MNHSPSSICRTARRRGNVLILVVVVLGLLALLGGAYLQTARVQRQIFFDAEDCSDLVLQSVVDDIKTILKDDLINPDTGNFFDVQNGTEPYDRPWTNVAVSSRAVVDREGDSVGNAVGGELDDTWLASAVPVLNGNNVEWPQISTLYGGLFDSDGEPTEVRRLDP